jgi:hypothetical protein
MSTSSQAKTEGTTITARTATNAATIFLQNSDRRFDITVVLIIS